MEDMLDINLDQQCHCGCRCGYSSACQCPSTCDCRSSTCRYGSSIISEETEHLDVSYIYDHYIYFSIIILIIAFVGWYIWKRNTHVD